MLLNLLFAAGLGSGAPSSQPTLSGLTATGHAGACPVPLHTNRTPTTSASIDLAWSISLVDDTLYEIHISENGGAPLVQPTSDTNYTKTIDGLVEGADISQTFNSYTFVVSVVRKSDNATLQTLSKTYATYYGQCRIPGDPA